MPPKKEQNKEVIEVTQLEGMQKMLKALTIELKKFSLDKENLEKHAHSLVKKEQKEREEKHAAKSEEKRRLGKKNFVLKKDDIIDQVAHYFNGFDDFDLSTTPRNRFGYVGKYQVEDYVRDNCKGLVNKYIKIVTELRLEMLNDFLKFIDLPPVTEFPQFDNSDTDSSDMDADRADFTDGILDRLDL